MKGHEEGWHFFVMEYVVGGNFERAVLDGSLDLKSRLEIVRQAGEALSHAHGRGIVHRDVKPSNILLDEAGGAKLTDFDLVTAGDSTGGTKTHAMMGTLLFAAPEALGSAKDAGPAADVYSLAVTTIFAIQEQALDPLFLREHEATITGLPCAEPIQAVLRKGTAFTPDERYGSIGEFCEDLDRAAREDSEKVPSLEVAAPTSVSTETVVAPSDKRIQTKTLPKTLQLAEDLEEREKVFEGIPDQLGNADSCLALVDQLKDGCRNGFDLFWLWWIVEEVERRWRPGAQARILEHFFDHIPLPKNLDILWTLDTPLDGVVPSWREIPAGVGQVGSPDDENRRFDDEGPVHRVEISRPYWFGTAPVTNAQYALLDPDKSFHFWPGVSKNALAFHPRVNVTWYEAVSFCRWLATVPGFEDSGPRLPVEEEWEIACRAGTLGRFWCGDVEQLLANVSWYEKNSENCTHRVGSKAANPWQLYDLHGNVLEWTASPWNRERYKDRPQDSAWRIDPATLPKDLAMPPRTDRVVRGGSFWDSARQCRSAYRSPGGPWLFFEDRGFRVLLSSAPSRPSTLES